MKAPLHPTSCPLLPQLGQVPLLASHTSRAPPSRLCIKPQALPGRAEPQSTSWLSGLSLRDTEVASSHTWATWDFVPLSEAPGDQSCILHVSGGPSDQGPLGIPQAGSGPAALVPPSLATRYKGQPPQFPFHPAFPLPNPRKHVQGAHHRPSQCQRLPLRQLPPHQSKQRRGQRVVGFPLWARPHLVLCAGPRPPASSGQRAGTRAWVLEGACESRPLYFQQLGVKESVPMTRDGGQHWAGDSWAWCLKGCQAQSVFYHCSCSWNLSSVRAATSLPVTAAPPGHSSEPDVQNEPRHCGPNQPLWPLSGSRNR